MQKDASSPIDRESSKIHSACFTAPDKSDALSRIEDLRRAMTDLYRENESLRGRIDAFGREIEDLQERIRDVEGRKRSLEQQSEIWKVEKAALKVQLDDLESKHRPNL